MESRADSTEDPLKFDSHLVAALGIHWAHAVSIRLVLESRSGFGSLCKEHLVTERSDFTL